MLLAQAGLLDSLPAHTAKADAPPPPESLEAAVGADNNRLDDEQKAALLAVHHPVTHSAVTRRSGVLIRCSRIRDKWSLHGYFP